MGWGGLGGEAGADRIVQLGAHLGEQLELLEIPRPLFLPLCVLLVVVLLVQVLVERVATRAAPLRVGSHVTEGEDVTVTLLLADVQIPPAKRAGGELEA